MAPAMGPATNPPHGRSTTARAHERSALQRAARRAGGLRDRPPGPHVPARRASTAHWTRPGRAGRRRRSPLPGFRSPCSTTASRPSSGRAGRRRWSSTPTATTVRSPRSRRRAREALMWVWRHRYEELGAREDVDYVLIFENRGVEVGVTLHHPHGQIYGYPFLPPVPALELAADERLGGCATCALLASELEDRRRVLIERDARRGLRPVRRALGLRSARRDARAPREPARLRARRAARAVAGAAGARARLRRAVRPAVSVRDGRAPGAHRRGGRRAPANGHLHVEFYPPLRTAEKLKFLAGSEQGAGTFISDTLPEESAVALREAIARGA